MSKVKQAADGAILFWCPGCDEAHHFRVTPGRNGAVWTWNGDENSPTVQPSILVRSVRPIQNGKPLRSHEYNGPYPPTEGIFDPFICHSFIREGRIEFLNDCSHEMSGQTIELPNWGDQ